MAVGEVSDSYLPLLFDLLLFLGLVDLGVLFVLPELLGDGAGADGGGGVAVVGTVPGTDGEEMEAGAPGGE